MEPEQRTFWMEVLGQLHTRLRQLALAGLVVLVAVSSDWFLRHRQLAEEQLRIGPQLDEIVSDSFSGDAESDLAKEIHKALNRPECVDTVTAVSQNVALQCLPSLSTDIRAAETARSSWKIFGQDLPQVLFRLVILCAPIVLLFGTVVTGSQLRAMHSLLKSEASQISVQQKLNSPYFARVTMVYGERRIVQILIAAAINLVHVLAVFMFVPAVLMLNNVVAVIVAEGRIVNAAILATSDGRLDEFVLIWGIGLVCALALYGIVVRNFARMVVIGDSRTVKDNGRE